jgi:hypothetical protein
LAVGEGGFQVPVSTSFIQHKERKNNDINISPAIAMVQVLVRNFDDCVINVEILSKTTYLQFREIVSNEIGIPCNEFSLTLQGAIGNDNDLVLNDDIEGSMFTLKLPLCGGIDFQHREGSKIGSGGQMSESQAALERKERLRKLALETIDITKDPYFLRNHLGTFECKLCLTLHTNEGNYLAHTQGKRHQYNLGRRAAMEAKNAAPRAMVAKEAPIKRAIKIGRPGYKVCICIQLTSPKIVFYISVFPGNKITRCTHTPTVNNIRSRLP